MSVSGLSAAKRVKMAGWAMLVGALTYLASPVLEVAGLRGLLLFPAWIGFGLGVAMLGLGLGVLKRRETARRISIPILASLSLIWASLLAFFVIAMTCGGHLPGTSLLIRFGLIFIPPAVLGFTTSGVPWLILRADASRDLFQSPQTNAA
jgi:hypothetical protein